MILKRGAAVFLLPAVIVFILIHSARGAELQYENIAHSPPAGYIQYGGGCGASFGQGWYDPSQGNEKVLYYHQGQLIAQQYWLNFTKGEEKQNWNDLTIVEGAPLTRVTFEYYEKAQLPVPAYQVTAYFVTMERVSEICP